MDLGIAGKIALVTGGSKGIGLAVAQGLAAEGARVVISARHETTLADATETVRLGGGEAFSVSADLSQADAAKALLRRTEEVLGQPDIVVINAGGPPAGRAETLSDADWARGYDLTLMSAVRLARAALPAMKAQGWGRIVAVTSVSIKQPVANLALSNAFRAGVTGFLKTLSSEVAADGVTVNAVGPGYTATERLEELFTDPSARERLMATIPARRFATPAEVAAAALFLSSQQAAYITGQTLIVDGGAVGATY